MIRFMRFKFVYFIISALVILPGLFFLVRFGLRPAIDFTGGSLVEIKFTGTDPGETAISEVSQTDDLKFSSIQKSGEKQYLIRLKPIDQQQFNQMTGRLSDKFGGVEEVRFETIGPTLGRELLVKTLIAAVVAVSAILLYVGWAFKDIKFGAAAVFALVHDVLVVVGTFAVLGKLSGVEVDSLFVTAVLTTMSFSVHDTIVVFDRIREYRRKNMSMDPETQINTALTETMGRSLNNSLTIIFMLLALFLLGGETIRWFVLALLIGTVAGTYSSPFVATPILFMWEKMKHRKSKL